MPWRGAMRWPDASFGYAASWNRVRRGGRPSASTIARRTGLILAWVAVSWLWAPAAMALVVSDVAKEFVCNCGCNKMLPDCVTPFAAILLGGLMISLAVGEWVARRRATQHVRLRMPASVEGKYLQR